MKNHDLARSLGSQYGNQFNIAFRCENLHSFLTKFILYSVLQFVSLPLIHSAKMAMLMLQVKRQ